MAEAMYLSKVQCAAVSTWRGEMMEPPQKGTVSPVSTRAACGGTFVRSAKSTAAHLPGVLLGLGLHAAHYAGSPVGHSTVADAGHRGGGGGRGLCNSISGTCGHMGGVGWV